MSTEVKPSIYDIMCRFFAEDDWRFQPLEGRQIVQLGFSGDNGTWQCYGQANDELERLIFYSVLPVKVPAEMRPAIAEFVTRANYGLIIGNFEMDYSDGEVRFKTSIDVEGGELTLPMVKTLVYANVLMMDKYLPGIMATLYGGTSPEEAVARVEQ